MKFFYYEAPLNLSAAANMEEDLDLIRLSKIKKMPVLRIYSFKKPAVTLGMAQEIGDVVDINKCEKLNIETAKRPTGGRAFFHYDDLSYAVADSNCGLFKGSVEESYKTVSGIILNALSDAGIKLSFIKNKNFSKDAFCFSSHIKYEAQFKGRKVIGSSQLRQKEYSMQHGSLNFNMDYDMAYDIFKNDLTKDEFIEFFKKNSITLNELKSMFKRLNFLDSKDLLTDAFKKY